MNGPTPTSLATEGTADPKDSPAYSHRVPIISLALSSLVFVAPSSFITVSVSQFSPSSFASRICTNSFARSSIHASSGNPSPSRQNGSRPRGAPHLPHIRNTLEIVFPQPLTPTSFPTILEMGSLFSISRTSSQARHAEDHLSPESQSPSAWRRSGVPAVPLVPSPFGEGPGE
ncbi:hypothetical protein BS47DRAFT_1393118 [Hydnum rufescens UP504]|uniref:Uncharacterized protein n=1 Tax=Hydnum rufescens UP504 TaxID=1448309 RepID=A0A9P6DWJ9_9AGAM|nr:hypothetical protein BS47DRAFT_1393118 [Hydnum rufescens UP504]